MFYVVHCIDVPGSPVRVHKRIEHRAYLDSQPLTIFAGGPLLDDAGENMVGSVLIIECDSREQIDVFLDNEPFYRGGLFAEVHVHRWDKRR